MEKRKESLCDIKLCRFCLTQDSSLTSLYDRSRDPILVTLPLKIMACVSVEVFPSDKMPSYICEQCRAFMDICYDFKQICRRADESCLQFVQNGAPISAIKWPPSLTKIFELSKRSISRPINTIMEGGAKIEVTSQENSENDEEEEETYDVKIGGSRGGSKCIKVTASGEKDTPSSKKAGFSSVAKLSRHVRAHAGERAYPCKYCNKSFVKSHHYNRHLRLKHEDQMHQAREPEFRCEQCSEVFGTQDDLYYHSAIHATQNLTCPLCQEKFENVDDVTTHIRTHVNGIEFMCEYCELVFTSKEKLDTHMNAAHDDEMSSRPDMDESSMDADADAEAADADADDDDEDGLNVKEEEDHMVVEIKKAGGYMLRKDIEVGQATHTNSEDSDVMESYNELAAAKRPPATKSEATSSRLPHANSDRISILRKAEAMKRKAVVNEDSGVPQKKERAAKVDSTTSSNASSDKSLRMLEKDLQELKRTTTRADGKAIKAGEAKSKRQPVHTSTPKLRSGDEKKSQSSTKPTGSVEKKAPERRLVTKDNKEPKEAVPRKENTVSSSKEDKSVSSTKEDKVEAKPTAADKDNTDKKNVKDDKQAKSNDSKNVPDKEDKSNASKKNYKEDVPSSSNKIEAASTSDKAEKSVLDKSAKNDAKETLKNGDTSGSEDNVVRRSTRPSKIKNYASMIRDRTRMIRDEDDDEEYSDDDAELDQLEADSRAAQAQPQRKGTPKRQKPETPTPVAAAATPLSASARRRGRPRKETTPEAEPSAELKANVETPKPSIKAEANKEPETPEVPKEAPADSQSPVASTSPTTTESQVPPNTLMSPIGQTLKKVPIKALPPGVKPLPLPMNARTSDLYRMQIGKKMVKVQKIVMTKAEVEAMAKKGLLELKDGTMMLKPGIKLPTGDPAVVRSGLVNQAVRKVSATPTRCNMEGEEP